jgi:hypothetical protein
MSPNAGSIIENAQDISDNTKTLREANALVEKLEQIENPSKPKTKSDLTKPQLLRYFDQKMDIPQGLLETLQNTDDKSIYIPCLKFISKNSPKNNAPYGQDYDTCAVCGKHISLHYVYCNYCYGGIHQVPVNKINLDYTLYQKWSTATEFMKSHKQQEK